MESIKRKAERLKHKAFCCILVCFGLFAFSFQPTKAQSFSFSDLFGQGNKELKNMAAQIEALNAFETSMRQGYAMMKGEWTAISNWKNGEFGLHQDYYTSLSTVNPQVKNDPDVATIQSEQQAIISLFSALQGIPGLLPYEQSYVQSVAQNILKHCDADLQRLQKVLESDTLTMSDDERLKEIAKLQADMLDKYRFTQSFCNSVRLLVIARNQEMNEVQTLNQYYENN
ncbi:hypothetical protein BEL04_00110 [Mucilaginibacter sp. PPCGB 2223]|uniref:hypothetical protein n=1 Tax=Mucilaginibacter sp. PPCGB 2223 TaxID=1886027 RepID=UPI000825E90A|nr:hypothetical protein [Mucilaginibacter sp. PPCGB 2223]OCX52778.1 hypothetical protein BEL04_00110 [Mucilaginibacter sp. PPCGB 2223]